MTYIDSSDMIKNQELNDDKLHVSKKPVPEDDNYLYTASTTDMTGLTPTAAKNEYEAQSYEELYPYLPPFPPLSPNSVITTPDVPVSEGIQNKYRKHVTPQSHHE